jgi:hypothetical protein
LLGGHPGHLPGLENRRIIAAGERLGINQEQLNQFVNANPDYFFIEEKVVNLSHINEIPGAGNLGKLSQIWKVSLDYRGDHVTSGSFASCHHRRGLRAH